MNYKNACLSCNLPVNCQCGHLSHIIHMCAGWVGVGYFAATVHGFACILHVQYSLATVLRSTLKRAWFRWRIASVHTCVLQRLWDQSDPGETIAEVPPKAAG